MLSELASEGADNGLGHVAPAGPVGAPDVAEDRATLDGATLAFEQVTEQIELEWREVDTALELTGGGGIFKRDRVEQLFRDARPGLIHPANTLLARELVGKLSLGVHPDEQPRWG